MKRIILSAALVLCTSVLAMAQITTGTPSAKNIRTGNRPQEGHFGIYLGMNSNVFQNFSSNKKTNLEVSPLPMVNFKYMYSDKLELRLGVELSRSRESLGVESKQTVNNVDYNIEGNCKYVESDVHFNPGISYHFNSNNILDVYVGAEATFG